MKFEPIGIVEALYAQKFATPRQANLVGAPGRIKLQAPYDDPNGFDGLELCSHIWVQFIFHLNRHQRWQPKVRPPRYGGNRSLGVFATRSPYRPNAIGLSLVSYRGLQRQGEQLFLNFEGGDMVDGTPVLDIKPYLPYADCLPQASNALAPQAPQSYPVTFSGAAQQALESADEAELGQLIQDVLALDPRPQYHRLDQARSYVCTLGSYSVRWRVQAEQGAIQAILVETISRQ